MLSTPVGLDILPISSVADNFDIRMICLFRLCFTRRQFLSNVGGERGRCESVPGIGNRE